MKLIGKLVTLKDVIQCTKRDKSDISYYYPVDTLLEIMKDLMTKFQRNYLQTIQKKLLHLHVRNKKNRLIFLYV